MKTGIYYFSATGNSLTTAKLLAASLDGQCDVISLAALHNKQDIEVDYERVGFVFPIYYIHFYHILYIIKSQIQHFLNFFR